MERLRSDFNYNLDEFIVLLPTAPFRRVEDIDAAISVFYENGADSVISCKQMSHPIEWSFDLKSDGKIVKDTSSIAKQMNRQEVSNKYMPNGSMFILKLSLIKKNYSYYSKNTFSYEMPPERSIDIDTEFDFDVADCMANKKL